MNNKIWDDKYSFIDEEVGQQIFSGLYVSSRNQASITDLKNAMLWLKEYF